MNAITETPADICLYGWRDISAKMPDGSVRTKSMAPALRDCPYSEEDAHISSNSLFSSDTCLSRPTSI